MKLTSLKEFYEKSDSKDILLYQEYLAAAKRDIIDGMAEAKIMLGEDDEIITQLESSIRSIENLESIIRNSVDELISNSIAQMSDDELKNIIDDYIRRLEDKKAGLSKTLDELKVNVDAKVKEYNKHLEQMGYKYTYYEKADVAEFFEEVKDAEGYIMSLVNSSLDKAALKATFSWTYTIDSVQEELASIILSLRKIAKICDEEVLKRAIQNFLTPEKIGKIIGIQDRYDCLATFASLQKSLKMRTEFFECLPDSLKEEMRNNGIVGNSTFNRLKAIYEQYKKDGQVVGPKNEDVVKEEAEINAYVRNIAELDDKIEKAKTTCESREKMIALVESFVDVESDQTLSYTSVSKEALDQRAKEKGINIQIDELNNKLEGLEQIGYKLGNLLSKIELREGFDILAAKRECKKMEEGQSIYCDREVESVYNAEHRRLAQFRLIGETILRLNGIKRELEEVNKSRNILKYATGANQKLREQYLEKYHETIDELYTMLQGENLLRINIARGYMDVEDETINKPTNFDELLAKPNLVKYHISNELYDEMEDRKLFDIHVTRNKVNNINEQHDELATKLFKAKKNLNGTYDFEISEAEISRLIDLQESFVSLYESVKTLRSAEKDTFMRLGALEVSEEFKQLIADVKMDLETVTQEDIERYQARVEEKINEVKSELTSLRGSLPQDTYIDSQYEMLNGLEDTRISSEEVRGVINFRC